MPRRFTGLSSDSPSVTNHPLVIEYLRFLKMLDSPPKAIHIERRDTDTTSQWKHMWRTFFAGRNNK